MRRGPVIAALLGWVLVVIVGAGRSSDTTLWLGIENLDAVYMVIMAAAALLGLALLLWVRPTSGDWKTPPKRKQGIWIFPFLVLALLLWRPEILDNLTQAQDTVDGLLENNDLAETEVSEFETEPIAQVAQILALLAIAGLAIGVWLWTGRAVDEAPHLLAADDEDDVPVDARLRKTIRTSARQLADATDPRAAVLRAYATLESEFHDRGQPRRPSETASEHLARVMAPLTIAAAPFIELGRLYELARFSEHPITSADQQLAASSLAAAQEAIVTER